MKNNTIYLEVTREKNSLKIGIRKKTDFSLEPSIDPYEIKKVSMETIGMVEKYCVETVDFLNKEEKKRKRPFRDIETTQANGGYAVRRAVNV